MIPKIIHYCWFGKGLMPKSQKRCIEGWKKLMPDYTFMRWDESTFDLEAHPLAKYACEVKKYALASDVCRYNVLSEYGGIYLDTDVELFERFDEFLDYNFFSGIELYREFVTENVQEEFLNPDGTSKNTKYDVPHLEILTSTMGCCKNLQMINDIRDYYESMPASADYAFNYRKHVNNDRLVARYLAKYGFRYKDETQVFGDGMIVYGTGTFGHAFCPNEKFRVSYHHNAATWEQERWSRAQKLSFSLISSGFCQCTRSSKS
jgi:Mannosyltransferase OCH1 and related enzymes